MCVAIEFWTTVAEEELYIIESGSRTNLINHAIIPTALPKLLPLLLEKFTQNIYEDFELDSWSTVTAAGTCLAMISQVNRNEI